MYPLEPFLNAVAYYVGDLAFCKKWTIQTHGKSRSGDRKLEWQVKRLRFGDERFDTPLGERITAG